MPPAQRKNLDWLHRWGPAVLMMAIIFTASSLPADSIPSWTGWVDLMLKKGGHMLGYGLLAISFIRGVGSRKPSAYGLTFVMVVLYAVSDELHQSFVPGRQASTVDVLIDGLGGAIALASLLVLSRLRTRQSSNSSSKSSSPSQPSAGAR